jgi:hypothetical protein
MIEFLLRANGKEAFEDLMKEEGWMLANGSLHREALCDPMPGSGDYAGGIPILEALAGKPGDKPPYYANVRITGGLEASQTAGWPQTDANGKLLPQWQRTELGQAAYRSGVPWTAANGTTNGIEFGNITFINIESVKSRKRVWQ